MHKSDGGEEGHHKLSFGHDTTLRIHTSVPVYTGLGQDWGSHPAGENWGSWFPAALGELLAVGSWRQ